MTARRAAVLGSPIGHSLSPVLHRTAYRQLGLDWEYEAIECDAAVLPATVARLAGTHVGLSLTMPLKEAALPLLDEVDEVGARIGAVNTLLFAAGRRVGYNTDVHGVLAALDELGVPLADQPVALLGAGGAARAVLAALAARRVGMVRVLARSPDRAAGLLELSARLGLGAHLRPWAMRSLQGHRLAVSAVPATAQLPDGPGWPAGVALLDTAYAPWPTPLAKAAASAGAPVLGGLPMLVAQAAEQVRLMTGLKPPYPAMRAAGEAALAERARAAAPTQVPRAG